MTIKIALRGYPQQLAADVVPTLVEDLVASSLTNEDPTLWGPDAESEASIRLGWVRAVDVSQPLVAEVADLRNQLLARGLTRVVLAGMGGSSLAAQVIADADDVPLHVLDSTAPSAVLAAIDGEDADALKRTVLVASSKSGTTLETDSALRAFEAAFRDLGLNPAAHIVVVTDPGSALETRAQAEGYRVFTADPHVGGRYSALTAYGLVPAGLAGANIEALLLSAQNMLIDLAVDVPDNPALLLGAVLGGARSDATPRRDKLGIIVEAEGQESLSAWIEQLLAESTGKQGTGILPVPLLAVSPEATNPQPDVQVVRIVDDVDDTRLFEAHHDEIRLSGGLGAQFMLWEYATAVAGRLLGINPFDQPDVEAAKVSAREFLTSLPRIAQPLFVADDIEVRANDASLVADRTIRGVLDALWGRLPSNGYVAIQAYVDPIEFAPLSGLRELVAADAGRPTTFGWGPRYLHSTGQYHKGGPLQGVFLQILARTESELEVPGKPYTFGQILAAQAQGDAEALEQRGRIVVSLTLTDPATDILDLFTAAD